MMDGDLRDSEGRCRFRYCRPLTVRDRVGLDEKGFARLPGDFEDTRRTLAYTNDGWRLVLEDKWRSQQKGLEWALAFACLGKEDMGLVEQGFDGQSTYVIGYSWFRDDQCAAPEEIP